MAIRDILKMGNPELLKVSEPVDFEKDDLTTLIDDMKETMKANDGAGLAAPQIGVFKRLVIFGFDTNDRYPEADSVPFTVLINPIITPLSDEKENGWEGCLSVPGLRGVVPRFTYIKYEGYDAEGNKIEREVEDFHARVVQHECDHLDGILYPTKIEDYRYFGFHEEIFKD
ncbi:peptide deformylase [Methylophilales bacterium MBRSG12]|uniref:Peptide deformylase n=1 Tax=Methylophilales bacterium MBRS-H7 TaxID=1623450 RepID=A0A0H4IXJ0_9PROT|nr:peptide deformylase [Methylophilales bacterium MBRSF5]AKO65269.1 peptide deformylase [Methylophilales bacterium MBRS-H7]AKO66588.1 peptide deformylase [Methylophilales bacterium MBRSG12]